MYPVVAEIENIIKERVRQKNYQIIERLYLHEGESRETIIKALWRHQKSTLPRYMVLHEIQTGLCEIYNDRTCKAVDFYDPETRIITVTDFGGE